MPETRTATFGSDSYLAVKIQSDTNNPSNVTLAFLPTVTRVRKARLSFDIAGADGFDVEIEFQSDRLEEFTVTGERKA